MAIHDNDNNQPFSKPSSEWQRVGNNSDSNWWQSGTNQQQQVYRGDTGYPYRENFDERNQQGQGGIENFYPQEPASEQQRKNFAEGSQFPYEGGYGAENIQARQGLERAEGIEFTDQVREQNWRQPAGTNPAQEQDRTNQNYGQRIPQEPLRDLKNQNQSVNQNPNTMRSDERYNRSDYNDYRNEDYGRDRNRREDRNYGYGNDRRDQRFDRSNDRGGFYSEQDRGYDQNRRSGRGYAQDWDSHRDRFRGSDRSFDQDRDYNRSGQAQRGDYYSTRSENPGRGYDTEREMNRHSYDSRGGSGRDRGFDYGNRNYRGDRNNRISSSHRETGSYEDFERDLDRYGIRDDYQNRYPDYNRREGTHDRNMMENRGFNYDLGRESENRRRLSGEDRDPRLDTGPSGSWGRNVQDSDRYEDRGGRGHY